MSLAQKLILFVLIVVFILTAVLVGYFYFEFKRIFTEHLDNYLVSLAETVEGQIFLFIDKTKIQLIDWSSDGYIKNEFEKIMETGDSSKIAALTQYIKINKHPLAPDIVLTDIFSLDGKAVISTFPARVGHREEIEEMEKEYGFESALRAGYGKAAIVTPGMEADEPGHETDPKMWHVSTVLYSLKSGKPIGVMVNHIRGGEIADILSGKWKIRENAFIGREFMDKFKTIEVYLVDKNGLMITPSRFIEDAILKQKIGASSITECLEKGEEFSGSYLNYLGAKVRGASACLRSLKAVLIIEVEERELFAEIIKERRNLIILNLILVFLSAPVIFLFTKFFLKNINIIRDAAIKLSKGDLSVRAETKSKDETGDLAKIFNQTIDSIVKSEAVLKGREKQLEDKVTELERFTQLAMGREQKMIELKKEIEELKNKKVG